ncbi:hypothetical protein SDC9_87002 [bioreactor metagenome]|uniref:HTH merR-type domain-containing protein n=1 Tax=bioreactor metagenome TaxID=1076179 RepID=A0A644ZHI1_9ZZZZ
MRTVKQVSELTGISVRMLHHYDKIGLLKPSRVTDSGYRLYDEEALETLQRILFFKELDLPLKSIKGILSSPEFDKMNALRSQKELLVLKRDRLNGLIDLIERTLDGGNEMSFKEFDMSEYYNVLDRFKTEHEDQVIKYFGDVSEFEKMMEHVKSKGSAVAEMAAKEYGSIEKYTHAMKKNLENLPEIMDGFQTIKENLSQYTAKTQALTKKLTSDLSRDPCSGEIQEIVVEMDRSVKETQKIVHMEMPQNYWGVLSESYLSNSKIMEVNDKKYGAGASEFMGLAFKFFSENSK